MSYKPKPINTTKVEIPKDLDALVEILSRNTHEIWSDARLKNGWSYGIERNDVYKQTPLLVPYDELPDFEKEVDRIITENILKTLLKLGYEIKKVK